jgi:hypothetical protein
MARFAGVVASAAILCLGVGGYARTHSREEPLDPSKGAKLSSRIPCDGTTNPQDQIHLASTFSPGNWERSFRVDVFQESYCRRMDLGFACLMPGHSHWKQNWSVYSSHPEDGSYGLDSCSEWGLKDPPQYVLTGWYREGGPGSKLPWKQAEVKQLSSRWETYEFVDPNGETGRLVIVHP